jgi:hypothetical protein
MALCGLSDITNVSEGRATSIFMVDELYLLSPQPSFLCCLIKHRDNYRIAINIVQLSL